MWLVVDLIGINRNVQGYAFMGLSQATPSDVVRYKGHWYMDPPKPATSKHMRAIVKELLANYDVAGYISTIFAILIGAKDPL